MLLAYQVTLVLTDRIEDEYLSLAGKRDVARLLARKRTERTEFDESIRLICSAAERVYPVGDLPPCRDPDDRMYLHCAVAGRVDYMVSYDDDLLAMVEIDGIPIVTPADFLRRVES